MEGHPNPFKENLVSLNAQYKSNKHPIAVIFVIYRKESKAKCNFAIDDHVNYIYMIQKL